MVTGKCVFVLQNVLPAKGLLSHMLLFLRDLFSVRKIESTVCRMGRIHQYF